MTMAKWMSNRQKYPLRGKRFENEISEARELSNRMIGERVRKLGVVNIDRSVFKKDLGEKLRLKQAKAEAKLEEMRRK